MPEYAPITKQVHLARGHCCKADPTCFYCPWRVAVVHQPLNIDPRIEAALRSGEVITIHSERMSLVPELTIGNLTIIYRKCEPK